MSYFFKHPFILFFSIISIGCSKAQSNTYSYLALGDSYTIGASVDEYERWPNQLTDAIRAKGWSNSKLVTVAKTGWRTDNMLKAAKSKIKNQQFDLVSLLIGVNNEFQGWEVTDFKSEFETCLNYAITHCKKGIEGVFVLSIPDYGYTPYGAEKQEKISKRIDAFNKICELECAKQDVLYINITDISRKGLQFPDYVAPDGLHPSGTQYNLWVKRVFPYVLERING